MRKVILKSVLGTAALYLTAVSPVMGDLNWTGCGITKKAFMKELAAAYEANTGSSVKLTGGGATKGIRAASAGQFADFLRGLVVGQLAGSENQWVQAVKFGGHNMGA